MKWVFLLSLMFLIPFSVSAQSVDSLRDQIRDREAQIAEIEKQIAEYQNQLVGVVGERRTLQFAIQELDLARNKLQADIRVTENRIGAAALTIQELAIQIENNTEVIEDQRNAIAKSLREIHQNESQSLPEQILAAAEISDGWRATDSLLQFQGALQANIGVLEDTQHALREDQEAVERKRRELAALQNDLSSEKSGLDAARGEKNQLLEVTKNEESQYQQLIQEKIEARANFEREMQALEDALQIAIDPDRIPKVGTGVLKWPFSNDFIRRCGERENVFGNAFCLTQYFGNTPFSTSNPQVYNGNGHNGIDFGASTGTPLEAALSGRVVEVGNTDQWPGCYSYGKWVLIEHPNGLSSLYAHLSGFAVSTGEQVSTGQVIGYSGNTGYSTGPHLHFTVFASQGVEVVRFGDVRPSTNCPNARIPVAPRDAYLNPLSYL